MSVTEQTAPARTFDLVLLVASLGGLNAVSTVLGRLPDTFNVPVAVLQHRLPSEHDERLAQILQRHSRQPVRTTVTGDPVDTPGVSVLPAGQTAKIGADRRYRLQPAPQGGGADELLGGAAQTLGSSALGVVLTGTLHDGAAGARAVKSAGGRVLTQDPSTAQAGGMPSAAIATGCIDFVLPLPRLATAITALAMAPGGAELLTVPPPPWAQLGS